MCERIEFELSKCHSIFTNCHVSDKHEIWWTPKVIVDFKVSPHDPTTTIASDISAPLRRLYHWRKIQVLRTDLFKSNKPPQKRVLVAEYCNSIAWMKFRTTGSQVSAVHRYWDSFWRQSSRACKLLTHGMCCIWAVSGAWHVRWSAGGSWLAMKDGVRVVGCERRRRKQVE